MRLGFLTKRAGEAYPQVSAPRTRGRGLQQPVPVEENPTVHKPLTGPEARSVQSVLALGGGEWSWALRRSPLPMFASRDNYVCKPQHVGAPVHGDLAADRISIPMERPMAHNARLALRLPDPLMADLLARTPPGVPLSHVVRLALVEYVLSHPPYTGGAPPLSDLSDITNGAANPQTTPTPPGWKFWRRTLT
jgi:hypothetical protein